MYRWLNRSKPSAISAASCAVWFWGRVVWWSSKLAVRQHCLSFHIMKVSRSEASLNSASRLAIVLLTLSCFRCCKKCRNNVKFKAGKIPRMGEECERCSTYKWYKIESRPSNSHGLDSKLIMVSWFSIQISRWIIKSKNCQTIPVGIA